MLAGSVDLAAVLIAIAGVAAAVVAFALERLAAFTLPDLFRREAVLVFLVTTISFPLVPLEARVALPVAQRGGNGGAYDEAGYKFLCVVISGLGRGDRGGGEG